MIRDLKREIEEYKKMFGGPEAEIFLASDIKQIWNLSQGRDHVETLFNSIGNALEVGFMLGYKNSLADADKKPMDENHRRKKPRKRRKKTSKDHQNFSDERDEKEETV